MTFTWFKKKETKQEGKTLPETGENTAAFQAKDEAPAKNANILTAGSEKEISEPIGIKMLIEIKHKDRKRLEVEKFQKNVLIAFKRYITLNDKIINFIGEGGKISVQLNNDGSLLNGSKVWRQIKRIKRSTKSKNFQQAHNEAPADLLSRQERFCDHQLTRLLAFSWVTP